jgi:hypothetical protein
MEQLSIGMRSACDRCTASKTSCDGSSPCGRCARAGAACEFSAQRKRGPVPAPKRKLPRDDGASADGSAAPDADVMATAVAAVAWPEQRPLVPTAQEESFLASFFLNMRTIRPVVDEAAFRLALRDAGTWSEARLPRDAGSSQESGERHALAVGFVLLYHTLLGLGSAMQGHKHLSALYLQRAVVQLGPAAVLPSECAVLGVIFLSFAAVGASRQDTDHTVAAHRAVALMGTAKGMCDGLDRLGRPASALLRIIIGMQLHVMQTPPGVRMAIPEPSARPHLLRLVEGIQWLTSEAVYGFAGNSSFEDGTEGPFLGRYLAMCTEVEQILSTTALPLVFRSFSYLFAPTVVCKVIARLAGRLPLPVALLGTVKEQVTAPLPYAVITLHFILCGRLLALVHAIGVPTASALVTGGASADTDGNATALQGLIEVIADRLLTTSIAASAKNAPVPGFDAVLPEEFRDDGWEFGHAASVSPQAPLSEFMRAGTAATHDGRKAAEALRAAAVGSASGAARSQLASLLELGGDEGLLQPSVTLDGRSTIVGLGLLRGAGAGSESPSSLSVGSLGDSWMTGGFDSGLDLPDFLRRGSFDQLY